MYLFPHPLFYNSFILYYHKDRRHGTFYCKIFAKSLQIYGYMFLSISHFTHISTLFLTYFPIKFKNDSVTKLLHQKGN